MMMRILILILDVSVNAQLRIYLTQEPIERIGTILYKRRLLTNEFESPKELAYDSSSRNLYFMYMDDDIQNSGRAFVNIETKRAMKIKGIVKNKATAVDSGSGEIYFGSEDGLYKYDPINNEALHIGLYNMNIHKIVIRNNEMYVIDANNHEIYKIFNGGDTAVRVGDVDSVMEFDVDNDKNIHLANTNGVYCIQRGNVKIKNRNLDVVYHFTVEGNRTYGVADGGIYDIHCANGTAKRVANLMHRPRSFAFGDYGDVFYSLNDDIFRLTPLKSYVVYNVYKNIT